MGSEQLTEKSSEAMTFVNKTFDLTLGQVMISPTYWQAGAIIFLLFVLVLTMARLRRIYVGWSFKAAGSMLFIGFFLTLVLEGFMLLGGRTLLTEVIGWKNAPKPISTALDAGRAKLVSVLGVTDEVPLSSAKKNLTAGDIFEVYQSLSPTESVKARSLICEP